MSGQAATMLAALRVGDRTAVELNRMGVGRPNSRAADLRKHGHVIVCDFDARQEGAARYVYRLLSDAGMPSGRCRGTTAGTETGPASLSGSGVRDLAISGSGHGSDRLTVPPSYPHSLAAAPLPERPSCSTCPGDSTAAASMPSHADDPGRDPYREPGITLGQLSLLDAA